jgi:hypothetical protein
MESAVFFTFMFLVFDLLFFLIRFIIKSVPPKKTISYHPGKMEAATIIKTDLPCSGIVCRGENSEKPNE